MRYFVVFFIGSWKIGFVFKREGMVGGGIWVCWFVV